MQFYEKISHMSQFWLRFEDNNLIMITSAPIYLKTCLKNLHFKASFYQTVTFFSELQAISSHLEKEKAINTFRSSLSPIDINEFDNLMNHINKKIKIGVTTKLVHNYYLKKHIPPNQHAALLPQLAEGGLANRICLSKEESQLTLYDVNLFLKYIAGVSGAGSQGQKSQKIIDVVENVSIKEGIYFLKLIDHKITIGAREKTFKSAKIARNKVESEEKKEEQT